MGSLISINVGLPRDVEWQGKIVRTAVWKRPVSGRVMARQLNIDGDGQGDLVGHGGAHRAVMVYQLDSYRYWEKYLQRKDLEYGQFGENLTVEGLPDNEVYIGDRYRIGSALFEVSQPRVTCYRVGLRMNNPQMPALLVSHHRPGFYFRVIEEGEIGAGDEIVKEAAGPERLTVSEMDALLYLPGHPVEKLQRALRIPALSAGWRQSFEALLTADGKQNQGGNVGLADSNVSAPAWHGFRRLRIAKIIQESGGVRSFVFESEDHSPLPLPVAGQFLILKLEPEKGTAPLLRSYSLSAWSKTGTYRISVKRADGAGSQFLHDHVRACEVLEVSAPRGNFRINDGAGPVVFLSAGIGATPVLAMLHYLASDVAGSAREIWWIYGTRDGQEHPFAAEVRELMGSFAKAHVCLAYSQPREEDRVGVDYDWSGRVNLSLLESLQVPKEADFYLCGPTAFLADLSSALRSRGVPQTQIHSETFGAGSSVTPGIASTAFKAPHQPADSLGTGPNVTFTRSALSVPWDNRFQSLLEFAEACDVPVKWSCRSGVCHMCESGLVDGVLRYDPEPLERPTDGNALICCSTPSSNVELDL
jgi:ferredoxin-NADP reductase/MOSC domain-containing protein YiiM/ferredoxin